MVYIPTAEEYQRYHRGDVAPIRNLEQLLNAIEITPGDHADLLAELRAFDSTVGLRTDVPHSLPILYSLLERNFAIINRLLCGGICKAHGIVRMLLTLPTSQRSQVVISTYLSFRAALAEITQPLECAVLFANPIATDSAALATEAADWWSAI